MCDKVYRVVREVRDFDWESRETICVVCSEQLANAIAEYVEKFERPFHKEDRGYSYYVTEHSLIHSMEEFIENEDEFLNDY